MSAATIPVVDLSGERSGLQVRDRDGGWIDVPPGGGQTPSGRPAAVVGARR